VVHAALEQLYTLPAAERGPETAATLVAPAWERVVAEQPSVTSDIDPNLQTELLEQARRLLSGYYRLEDPTRFDPTPEDERDLRERLLAAGEQRAET